MNYINTSASLLVHKKNVPLKASLSSSIFLTNPSPSWILNILIHPRLVASSKANLGTFCTDHGLDRMPGPSGFAAPREARTGRLVENCRDTVGFRRIRAGAESDIVVCGSEDNEGGHKQPRKCKTRNDVQRKDPLSASLNWLARLPKYGFSSFSSTISLAYLTCPTSLILPFWKEKHTTNSVYRLLISFTAVPRFPPCSSRISTSRLFL